MAGKNIYFTKKELDRLDEIMKAEIEKDIGYLTDIPNDREVKSIHGFNLRIRRKLRGEE
jgi:hypothetical protein